MKQQKEQLLGPNTTIEYRLASRTGAAGLAIIGEFMGGLGLVLGLFARIAATATTCVMLAAIAYAHIGHGLFASNGGWEYPLTLLLVSLTFVVRGGGPYSLDATLNPWKRARGVLRPQPQPTSRQAQTAQ